MNGVRSAELVDKVIFFVEKHMENNRCLVMVEEMVGQDHPNYQAIFEYQVGMTLNEYVLEIRRHTAKQRRKDANMGYKEISHISG